MKHGPTRKRFFLDRTLTLRIFPALLIGLVGGWNELARGRTEECAGLVSFWRRKEYSGHTPAA